MEIKTSVYTALDQMAISYEAYDHPPIFTIDALDGFDIPNKHLIAKNLFLRNDKGNQHFLVVIRQDKVVDLKAIRAQIKCSRLSFASEARLLKYLNLEKGSVTPIGIHYDQAHHVQVFFDRDLEGAPCLGFHPNHNTATVFMGYEAIKTWIEHDGHVLNLIDV